MEPCEKEARVRHLLAMKSGVYHRAPLQGYEGYEQLLRLLDARTGEPSEDPELVPFQPEE